MGTEKLVDMGLPRVLIEEGHVSRIAVASVYAAPYMEATRHPIDDAARIYESEMSAKSRDSAQAERNPGASSSPSSSVPPARPSPQRSGPTASPPVRIPSTQPSSAFSNASSKCYNCGKPASRKCGNV